MKLEQYLLHMYLRIDYESFTHKAVSALGILEAMKSNPMNQSDKVKKQVSEDITACKRIIEETDENTKISMFVLDRNILPQDMQRKITKHTTTWTNKEGERVELTQDQIQYRLAKAMQQIHLILMRNIAAYSDQMSFEGF